MVECLYNLPRNEYLSVTNYLREHGECPSCHCAKCIYHAKRIEAKSMVPKRVYDSGTFQQSLRMVNGLPHRTFVMSGGDVDSFVKALFGIGE